MKHRNSVQLAGPIGRVNARMFGDFGFLELSLAMVRVKIKLSQKNPASLALEDAAKNCRSAVLHGGSFSGRQDNKDASKWWYDVSGGPKSISFLSTEVPILNSAEVVGQVKSVHGNWLSVASTYMIPGREGQPVSWKSNLIWVLCSQPYVGYEGKEVLVVGSARPKVGTDWRLHLAAEGVWPLS